MQQITVEEAAAHLPELVREARSGQEIVFADGLQPVARLVPVEEDAPPAAETARLAMAGGAFDWLADEPDLYDDTCGEAIHECLPLRLRRAVTWFSPPFPLPICPPPSDAPPLLWASVPLWRVHSSVCDQQNTVFSAPDAVLLLPGHPDALTGLSVASKLRAGKLVTLAPRLLTRRLGHLGPALTADLDRALVSALSIDLLSIDLLSIDLRPVQAESRRQERERLAAVYGSGRLAALLADIGLPPPLADQ